MEPEDKPVSGTSSISSLPNEILEAIFLLSLSDELNVHLEPQNMTPNYLCLVCRRWRDVTVNYPPLWSDIVINGEQMCFLPCWQWWLLLERSGNTRLRVRLVSHKYTTADDIAATFRHLFHEDKSTAMLSTPVKMRDIPRRIEEMAFVLPAGMELENIDPLGQGHPDIDAPSFLNLRLMSINPDPPTSAIRVPLYLQGFFSKTNAPDLETLAINMIPYENELDRVYVPSPPSFSKSPHTVSTLRLGLELCVQDVLSLFDRFPLLHTLEINGVHQDYYHPQPPAANPGHEVYCKHLHTLSLIGYVDPSTILSYLHAPRLEMLRLGCRKEGKFRWRSDPPPPLVPTSPIIHAFFTRSCCPIRSLSLLGLPISAVLIADILPDSALTEHLQHLHIALAASTIQQRTSADVILHALSISVYQGQRWCSVPRLKSLRLDGHFPASDGYLARVIEDRFGDRAAENGVESLEFVDATFIRDDHLRDKEQLADLRKRGLKASMLVNYKY